MKNDWTLKEVMMPGSVSSFHLMASSVQRQLTKALMSPKRRINDKFNFHFYIMTYSSRGRYVTGVYNVSCVVAGGPGPQPPPPGAAFPPPPPPAHPHPRPHHHPHHQVSTRPLHTHTHAHRDCYVNTLTHDSQYCMDHFHYSIVGPPLKALCHF